MSDSAGIHIDLETANAHLADLGRQLLEAQLRAQALAEAAQQLQGQITVWTQIRDWITSNGSG